MLRSIYFSAVAAALLLASSSWAQVPADAPAGTTGLCKDGTYSSNATKKGACSGHKGVKTWYATGAASAGTSAASASGGAGAAPAAPAAAPAAASKPAAKTAEAPAAQAAPGGGPGKVWVNTSTKVYHCQNDRWYGKTKNGSYMTEAEAKAQGDRPDHGKACQ